MTLEVQIPTADGGWRTVESVPDQFGPRKEPLMAQQQATDRSGAPIVGATLLARVEPVNPESWTGGDYPAVGVGYSNSLGQAVLTPALEPLSAIRPSKLLTNL
jgi:hypothetical protein